MNRLAPVPLYFLLRMLCALLLLKLSASQLPPGGFASFAQLMLFGALLNLVAVGGVQNGLVQRAAAAANPQALAAAYHAALCIWIYVAPILALAIVAAGRHLSLLLVGSAESWVAVVAIGLLALAAGPGQIGCSLLTGRKRMRRSLAAQAIGLGAGTALASGFILRGEAAMAAIGFAAGPLVTLLAVRTGVAALAVGMAEPKAVREEMRLLLGYSGALVIPSAITALALFGLRSLYRESFDVARLSYWIAANRISDMSSQLIGLFMIQHVVPHLASIADGPARRRFLFANGAIVAGAMATAIALFSIAPEWLVRLFLSPDLLPAIPTIQAYMLGDLLRVLPSFAIYTAFAAGRPGQSALIETGITAGMGLILLLLIRAGNPHAPEWGYAGAQALAALTVLGVFLMPAARRPHLA